eukprot:scaffold157735_cov36-Tisochrysis_lutea.AAC.1
MNSVRPSGEGLPATTTTKGLFTRTRDLAKHPFLLLLSTTAPLSPGSSRARGTAVGRPIPRSETRARARCSMVLATQRGDEIGGHLITRTPRHMGTMSPF